MTYQTKLLLLNSLFWFNANAQTQIMMDPAMYGSHIPLTGIDGLLGMRDNSSWADCGDDWSCSNNERCGEYCMKNEAGH